MSYISPYQIVADAERTVVDAAIGWCRAVTEDWEVRRRAILRLRAAVDSLEEARQLVPTP